MMTVNGHRKAYIVFVLCMLILSGCGNSELKEKKVQIDKLVGDVAELEMSMMQDKLIRSLNGYSQEEYRKQYQDLYAQVGQKAQQIKAVGYPRESLERDYGDVLARMGLCRLVKNPNDVVSEYGLCRLCSYCNGGEKWFD